MTRPVRPYFRPPTFDLGGLRVKTDFFKPMDLSDTSVFKGLGPILPVMPLNGGLNGRLTLPIFAPASRLAPMALPSDEGLLAMGKKGRRSEMKMERRPVVLEEDAIIVKGTEMSYLNFYVNTKRGIEANSDPFNRRRAGLMDMLEKKNDYQTALMMAILELAGDKKWWPAISPFTNTAEPDLDALTAAVTRHFVRIFPDAGSLPASEGLWTELNASWRRYRAGEISAREMSYTLAVYSNLWAARPVFDGTDIKMGEFKIARSELLKMSTEKLQTDIRDFLDSGNKTAVDLYRSTIEAGRKKEHLKIEGIFTVSTMEEAVKHMVYYRALRFLESGDVPQEIKEEAAALFIIGGDENYQGTVLLFAAYVEARQTSPKYFSITCRMETEIKQELINNVHKRFLNVFGIEEAETAGTVKPRLAPLSLSQEVDSLPAPSSEMSPGRSLAIFRHPEFFVRLMVNGIRAQLAFIRTVEHAAHDKAMLIIRFLESPRYSLAAKTMLVDMLRQLSIAHSFISNEACAVMVGFASNPSQLASLMHDIYFRAHKYAQTVLEEAQKGPAEGVQTFLSERRFPKDAAHNWDTLLGEAGKRNIYEPAVIERLSAAASAAEGDEATVGRWLSAVNWDMLAPYLSAKGPLSGEAAIDMAAVLQDAAYPPRGRWTASMPEETLGIKNVSDAVQQRVAAVAGFLSRNELDGLKATIRSAESETKLTHDAFVSRFPGRPIADGHPDLHMWLQLWPQGSPDGSALERAVTRLARWMHGEEEGIEPAIVRTLIRRGVGDSLSLRTLLVLANMDVSTTLVNGLLARVNIVLKQGVIKGDVLNLVMKVFVPMAGVSATASRAELSSVLVMLGDGRTVRLIPTDKALNDPTPDLSVVDKDGAETLVEVKTVNRQPGNSSYLDSLSHKIVRAARQLNSYASGEEVRRSIHMYVLSPDNSGISDAAAQWARSAALSAGARMDEIRFVPVNVGMSGNSWLEGEAVKIGPLPAK